MADLSDGPRFDVICVGDIATDVYVELSPDHVEVRQAEDGPRLVLPFGAKIPYQSSVTVAAGGNAANVAVACARLGLRVALASYLGADQTGRDLLSALHAEGIDTSLVRLDQRTQTDRHFVLRLGQERTILVHHEQHDYHWPHLRPSEVPSWLYLSSVGRDAQVYEDQLADWLEENPSVALAFEPGTYQIARGAGRLARLYRRAALLVCNLEEARAILGVRTNDVDVLLRGLRSLGAKQVVITDGRAGATAADDTARYSVPIYPDAGPVVDRTGAGDAFSGTVLAALVGGKSLEEALLWAPVNAMSVVHTIGTQAGLLSSSGLAAYLEQAPSGFVVSTEAAGRTPDAPVGVTEP